MSLKSLRPRGSFLPIVLFFTCLYSGATTWKSAHTWGGAGSDNGIGVALDSAGNIYVAGSTTSFGAGRQDVLVVKYSAAGVVRWAKTWGGSGDEYATAAAVGPDGFVYVTGATSSFGAGWYDMFLLKLDTSGKLVWGSTWGGGSYETGQDIGFDAVGNIYVVGQTYSFSTASMLIKFSPNGGVLWTSSYKGPATYDTGISLTVDSKGNVVVAGISWDHCCPAKAGCADSK